MTMPWLGTPIFLTPEEICDLCGQPLFTEDFLIILSNNPDKPLSREHCRCAGVPKGNSHR
jgi:hypothetical protein